MADQRITGLSPGLLLTALALWGCPGSPSHMSTLPPEAPPPPPPGTLTERVTHGSGLIIAAGSNYDLTRELELIGADWELAQAGGTNAMMAYLGTRDSRYISSQVADIHRFILPRLSRKITQSPLGLEPWNGAFRLSFNVWTLFFMIETDPRVERPHPICWMEIGVSLHETAGDSLLFRQQQLIVRERHPDPVGPVRNETPAGRSTLEPVHEKAAQAIFDAFNAYWSSRP